MAVMTGYKEGTVAKTIERRTAHMSSDVFLWAAVGSIGASLIARLMNRRDLSHFIGLWAPTILVLGMYNKMVKLLGSESR